MGERSILVSFEPEISEKILQKVLSAKADIEAELVEEKVEVINTYNSVLVNYPFTIEDVYEEVSRLERLLNDSNIGKKNKSQVYQIPVCYDPEFGLDLDLIAREKNLSPERIIELHSAPLYTVYFIGFLPGFLYLGGLDDRLQVSRKEQPRLEVVKGAVGIGENQTGIYPKTSPGGWQLLGNSPVPLFDKDQDPPCQIEAGDKVKFYPVSAEEHSRIRAEVTVGKFQFEKKYYDS